MILDDVRPGSGGNDGVVPPPAKTVRLRLAKLYEDVGHDQVVVRRFVTDYLALLDARIATIRADLQAGDDDATQVSLLSLETTSVMIGASAVADAARAVRIAVEHGDGSAQPRLLQTMLTAATELRSALSDHPDLQPSADPRAPDQT